MLSESFSGQDEGDINGSCHRCWSFQPNLGATKRHMRISGFRTYDIEKLGEVVHTTRNNCYVTRSRQVTFCLFVSG